MGALGISSLDEVLGGRDIRIGVETSWDIKRNYATGGCRVGSVIKRVYSVTSGAEGVEKMYLLSTALDLRPYAWNISDGGEIGVVMNYSSEDCPVPPMTNDFIVITGQQSRFAVAPLHSQCYLAVSLKGSISGLPQEEGPEEPQVIHSPVPEASWTGQYNSIEISTLQTDSQWVINKVLELSGTQTTTTTTATTTSTTTTTTTSSTTTTTATTTTTTATTGQVTETPSLEGVGISDGSELTYVMEYSGTGPGGTASGKVRIKYTVRVSGDGAVLEAEPLTTVTENDKAMFVLGMSISDLFASAAAGGHDIRYGPDLSPELSYECPLLYPGKEGERSGQEDLGTMKATYTCRYSKGVLQYIEAHITISYGGQSGEATLKAYIEGAPPAGGAGIGGLPPIALIAVIGAVAAAAVIAVVVLRSRR